MGWSAIEIGFQSSEPAAAARIAARAKAAARRRVMARYASIHVMHRGAAYFFWFSYLTPLAVERI